MKPTALPYHYKFLTLGFLFLLNTANAQWKNEIFNADPEQVFKSSKGLQFKKPLQLGLLQYTKDNEYFQLNSPGETFFGQRIWAIGELESARENQPLTIRLGLSIQFPFQQQVYQKLAAYPIIQLEYHGKKSMIQAGNIDAHVQHNLPDPVISYDYALSNPVEYGLNWRSKHKNWDWNSWLNWRQLAVTTTSQQEIISFGNRGNWQIVNQKNLQLNLPVYTMMYHKGGEDLAIPKNIQNKLSTGVGFQLSLIPQKWFLEIWKGFSNDFSPQRNQPFRNGDYWLFSATKQLSNNHRIQFNYFQGTEFHSPLGNPLFGSVNLNNPYKSMPLNNLLFARYSYNKKLNSNQSKGNAILEFRFEPIFKLPENEFLFNIGLYLKYTLGGKIAYQP